MLAEIKRLEQLKLNYTMSDREITKLRQYKFIIDRSGPDWEMYRAQFPKSKMRSGKSPYRPVK